MSTNTPIAAPVEVPRKPRRTVTRVLRWVNRLVTPPVGKDTVTGGEAVTAMMSWALAEITLLEKRSPQVAERARWDLSRSLATWSSRAPKTVFEARGGVTEDEMRALLNPRWAGGASHEFHLPAAGP
jgi:hypothetical protein